MKTLIVMVLLVIGFSVGHFTRTVSETQTVKQDGEVIENTTVPTAETNEAPQIPVSISGTAVDFQGKGLTKVPEYIFSTQGVTTLDLSHNNLTGTLPAEVRKLSSLVSLDLSHNAFTGVPAEIGQLSKLKYLDLSDNPITGLPYELGNLSHLKTLDLRGTNYAVQDLEHIRASLNNSVTILTDTP